LSSLNERLITDMKEAMKQREAGKIRLSTIRLLRAAQKEAEVARKRELDDDEILELIVREIKKRRDAIPEYEKANRLESIKQLEEEIAVLTNYLPEQMDEDALKSIIQEAINQTGAGSAKDMGRVMKTLLPRIRGRADSKKVSQMVKEMLSLNGQARKDENVLGRMNRGMKKRQTLTYIIVGFVILSFMVSILSFAFY